MLNNFFKLNEPYSVFESYEELTNHFSHADDLKNVLYKPDLLPPVGGVGFRDKRFVNVSFSKKKIQRATFTRCKFVDCLFIGTTFEDCEFHDCTFENCNPYKCAFVRTYIDPAAFRNMLNRHQHSNIGVNLFSRLRLNCAEMHQRDFEASADFEFRKWKRYQLVYDYRQKHVSGATFARRWVPDFAFYVFAGYGYRGMFFGGWTILLLVLLVSLNHFFAGDFAINVAQSPDASNSYIYSFYHTVATFTTLGSNAVALTLRAVCLLAIEACLGVVWLSVLTSIVVKRVVR